MLFQASAGRPHKSPVHTVKDPIPPRTQLHPPLPQPLAREPNILHPFPTQSIARSDDFCVVTRATAVLQNGMSRRMGQ